MKSPVNGGEAVQVTRDGGGPVFEASDGKYLHLVKKAHIWRTPLGGGPEKPVVEEPLSYGSNLDLVGDGIYFVGGSGFGSQGILYFFDFATERLTRIATIPRWFLGLTVSPDGMSILYSQLEPVNSSLMLIENFQ